MEENEYSGSVNDSSLLDPWDLFLDPSKDVFLA